MAHIGRCWLTSYPISHASSSYLCCFQGTSILNHMQWCQFLLLKTPSKLPSEVEKTRVLAAQYQMACSPLKVLVSVPGPALPLRVRDLRSHRLVVGVASAHSLASLRVGAQTPSPQLEHSRIWTWIDLPMNKKRHSQVGCGLSPEI